MSLSGHLLRPIEIRPLCFYLFHKIHCGAVSVGKDYHLTFAHSSKVTRSPHVPNTVDTMYTTYSDALKGSFSPELVPMLA